MIPGIEEAALLRRVDVWSAGVGYTLTEAEAQTCSTCTQQNFRYTLGGNVLAATAAIVGSKAGLQLPPLSPHALAFAAGSSIVGGLCGWCVANVACFRSVLELRPPCMLPRALSHAARLHGSPALRSRYANALGEADK